MDKSLFNTSDLKDNSSTPKKGKDRGEESKNKDDFQSCRLCNYKCKKESSLENHMVTKHVSSESKECKEKLPSSMKLPKHMAENHYKEQEYVQNKRNKDKIVKNPKSWKQETRKNKIKNLSSASQSLWMSFFKKFFNYSDKIVRLEEVICTLVMGYSYGCR